MNECEAAEERSRSEDTFGLRLFYLWIRIKNSPLYIHPDCVYTQPSMLGVRAHTHTTELEDVVMRQRQRPGVASTWGGRGRKHPAFTLSLLEPGMWTCLSHADVSFCVATGAGPHARLDAVGSALPTSRS